MKKSGKKRLWLFLFKFLFITGFIYMIYYQSWVMDASKLYERKISASYRGVIVKKYYIRAPFFNIKVGKKIIDTFIRQSLYDVASVGDSIIKFGNSNCCALIRNDSFLIRSYLYIPDKELSRSKYLQEIKKKDCNHLK